MKWFAWLVIAALLVPTAALAQSGADSTPVAAESIGEGWAITHEEQSAGYPMPWDRQTVYGGPEGARATVWVLDLGFGLEWVSGSWSRMSAFWVENATAETGIADPTTASILVQNTDAVIHDDVTDRKCVEGADAATSATISVCLYGSYEFRVGVMVIVEGTVNGLTGVAATDYVAGLYFAALSAE